MKSYVNITTINHNNFPAWLLHEARWINDTKKTQKIYTAYFEF